MARIPITRVGMARLQSELKRLRETERPSVIQAIATAREHGDLSENAEYHAARERQSFIEGRIAEIESAISKADIIDPSQFEGSDSIKFGATVKVVEEQTGQENTYQIVSEHESNIDAGRVSSTAPLAKAMIGKSVNDLIEVKSPGGLRKFRITHVAFV